MANRVFRELVKAAVVTKVLKTFLGPHARRIRGRGRNAYKHSVIHGPRNSVPASCLVLPLRTSV